MSEAQFYDSLGEALKAQCERFGPDAFENRRRVISLLADALPEARREIRAVASALDEGAVEALRGVERSLLGMEMDRQADRLEQSVGLRPDLAKQVIRALAFALNLGPPPSVYEAANAAPAPSADDWAGVSETVTPNAPQGATHTPHAPHTPAPRAPAISLNTVLFNVQGRAITVLHAAGAAIAVVLAAIFIPPMIHPRVQTAQLNGQQNGQPVQEFAGELTDNGVAPKSTLEANVGSPTPISIPGAQRVTTVQLYNALRADQTILLVDVLGDAHPRTIQGAHYLPAAGKPGTFNDAFQSQTAQGMQSLTGGDRNRIVVFFCAGAACWESYNAVLRARSAGYARVYWYRGGLSSWNEARLPFQNLPQATN